MSSSRQIGIPSIGSAGHPRTVLWLLVIVGTLLFVGVSICYLDTFIAQNMAACCDGPVLDTLETVGTLMGGWKLAPAILAVTLIAAGWRWRRLLGSVLVAYLIRSAAVEGLKYLSGRPRPRDLGGVTEFYGPGSGYHSFPSGHAAFAFMFATIAAAYFPRWRWAWYGWAVYICLMRMAADAHFLSDVVLGGLIGVLSAMLVLHWWPPDLTDATRFTSDDDEAVAGSPVLSTAPDVSSPS